MSACQCSIARRIARLALRACCCLLVAGLLGHPATKIHFDVESVQFFDGLLPCFAGHDLVSEVNSDPSVAVEPNSRVSELDGLFRLLGIGVRYRDERFVGQTVDVRFVGELRPEQMKAAEALIPHDTGILEATTAFGKTVLGAWMIAHRGVNTLVLVHRQQLMDQWIERLACFLDVPRSRIGSLAAGRRRLGGVSQLAMAVTMGG